MVQRTNGMTLVELLVTLAIASVLLGAALPSMRQLAAASNLDATTRRLFVHIQLTRTSAVHARSMVTLCPLGSADMPAGTRCGSVWANGYVVFIDRDGDMQRDEADTVLAIETAEDGVQVDWRSFRRRSALQFRPDGATHLSNGTFTLCTSGESPSARRLVVNVGGRVRTERHEHAESLCD